MAARQQTDFSPSAAGGLFLQIDMLSQMELQDSVRLHTLEVEGYNPAWAEPLIRRNFSHRHISDRPYLRLALHALRQELDSLKGCHKGADFKGAVDWINESNSPLTFALTVSILELSSTEARRAISSMHRGVFNLVESLCLLRIRDAEPVAQLTAKQRSAAVKAARDEREALIAAETVSRARSFARGLEWPLHAAWSAHVIHRKRKERAAAKQAAAAPTSRKPTPFSAINLIAPALQKQ